MLDWVRSRLLVRASIRLDREIAAVLLDTTLARPDGTIDAIARQAMRDFDAFRQAITGPVLLALCDAPWAPIYVLVCFIIHPALGLLVLAGSMILGTIAWANERGTSARLRSANDAAAPLMRARNRSSPAPKTSARSACGAKWSAVISRSAA